jgi:hypothetical protein
MALWKKWHGSEPSDEEQVLDSRVVSRLQRVARESSVPIGAHWQTPPAQAPAPESRTEPPQPASPTESPRSKTESPAGAVLQPPSVDTGRLLLAPPADLDTAPSTPAADADVPILAFKASESVPKPTTPDAVLFEAPAPIVEVEHRTRRRGSRSSGKHPVSLEAQRSQARSETGPRVARAVPLPRRSAGAAPLKATAVKPMKERPPSNPARGTVIRPADSV